MIISKFFRLYAPEPDTSGTATIDRGDLVPDDLDPDDPDAAFGIITPEAVKDDPAVKELEAELETEVKDDEPKKKDARIPLSRHEAVLSKEREKRADLERQLAQFQKGDQIADMNADLTAAENSIIALEKEYATLLTDGEVEKAAQKMQQIRKTEREMAEAKSDMKIHAAEVRATERVRYNTAIERVEAAFPELNPDHADYNEDTAAEVLDLMEAYKVRGMTPTAALQKAVKVLVEPRTTRQQAAVDNTPRVSDKDVAAERKKDAAVNTAKAIAKTPASLARTGINSDKLGGGALDAAAVMKMSQKEFAGLSESDLAKMRGDEI